LREQSAVCAAAAPTIDPSLFAPVPYNPRYSRKWASTRAQREANARAESQRVVDHYDEEQQRRDARENAEAKERAAAARR
jgi:hypothetical protein